MSTTDISQTWSSLFATEEQRRATRRQIQKAIDMKDSEMLERYIQAYEKLNPPLDDEVLQKARKTLAALDAKEGIRTT